MPSWLVVRIKYWGQVMFFNIRSNTSAARPYPKGAHYHVRGPARL